MECIGDTQIAAFVSGGLPHAHRAAVEDHIDDCDDCRTMIAGVLRGSEPASASWYPGARVGRYVIGDRIGSGGMGTVYRAEDCELARPVALKRLHRGGHAHLVREARVAAQLQHPNVVAVYEVVDGALPFIAMELVDGVTLTAWLAERAHSWHQIIGVLVQAGRGLAAAHARGLVHRDFKPDNVLVDRELRARVADFGIASGPPTQTRTRTRTRTCDLRITASTAGTPAYTAPELVAGAPPDARSDLYAFAVTAFEALHGAHPFAGTTVDGIWAEMAAGRIREGKRRLPARLERCVRRGLAVRPDDRWPEVAAFVAALERIAVPRRYAIAGGIGGAVIAAGIAIAASHAVAAAPVDDCVRGSELVSGVWNAGERDRLTTAFTAAAPNRGGATAAAVGPIVDGWSAAWQLGRRSACSAGDHRAARVGCLDRQLDELRAQLALWARPSAGDTDLAIAAVGALPAPTECSTADDDLPLRASVVAGEVSETRVLLRSGHATDALPRLPALIANAEAVGHHGTLAAALVAAARIEGEAHQSDAAIAHAARGASEAAAAGDNALLYNALIEQAYARIDAGNPADALGLCDAADALLARGMPNPEKAPMARGGALMRLGRLPESVVQYQRVIAILEAAAARDPARRGDLGTAIQALGGDYLSQRDMPRAIDAGRRALALQEAAYGLNHPEVARTLHDLGQAEFLAGDLAAATVHTERARALLAAAYGEDYPEVGEADVALATFVADAGRFAEARAMLDRARLEVVANEPPDHPIFEVIEDQYGELDEGTGHFADAIRHYQRGEAILIAGDAGGDELGQLETRLARVLFTVGRVDEAASRAGAALAQWTRAGVADHELAATWAVQAQIAAAHRDRAHAIELARKVLAVTRDDDREEPGAARRAMRTALAGWTRR